LPSPPGGVYPNLSSLTARGRTVDARIVGQSREIDLAVLKIKGKDLPALPNRAGRNPDVYDLPDGLRAYLT
jgi:S1-C subfamily serine protease